MNRNTNVIRFLYLFLKIGLAIALIGFIFFWFLFSPVSVTSYVIGEGDIVSEVMGVGTLDAKTKATISTKISGRLEKVLVDQGDAVHSGQQVALLDDQELRHQVEIEEANVTARKASVERLVAEKALAFSSLDLARKNHQRTKLLYDNQSISEEEYDRSLESLTTAQAYFDKAVAALSEGNELLIVAEKTLNFHKARLDDTVIVAPFDGVIIRRDRDAGDVVVPGSSIFFLISTREMWIRSWVDETRMSELSENQPARIVFRSEPDRFYLGKVARLGMETDRETREFLVDVRPDKLPERWTVGQRAEVFIETVRKNNVTLIPAHLLDWRNGSPGVFVMDKSSARWRSLKLGIRGRDAIEILEGLTPGETIIRPADPGKKLSDGKRISLP
ncbi:efflux RND transporter periplasmic adaptor subunit [Candidatus Sumerlaeota bacterium]|nr:efflux RND transporter periplasmic adaptor subunit [Candidatus Sumerlaeota bacterium]